MANGNIPILANLNLNKNEIRDVKFEILSADPTGSGLYAGRFWYNSVSKALKFYDGTNIVTLGYGEYIPASQKGAANGVAPLDANSKVDAQYLPSYVDDIVETYIVSGATALTAGWLSLTDGGSALTPDTGKIYVILTAGEYQNRVFRWSGTTYVEISPGAVYTAGDGLNLNNGVFSLNLYSGNGLQIDSTDGYLYLDTAYVDNGQGYAGAISGNDIKRLKSMSKMLGYQENNGALTAAGGLATWTVNHGLGTQYLTVQVYEISSGNQVMCDVSIGTTSPYAVTISLVSSSNIAADTYRVHIVGYDDETAAQSQSMH